MKRVITAVLALCLAPAVHGQVQAQPIIVNGTCDPKSGVTINGEEPSQFDCDTAVIARTERGTVMIQFTDKSGDAVEFSDSPERSKAGRASERM